MKKTTFTLLLSLSCCWLAAQCPAEDITFSTQGQIDSFPINHPGCTDMPWSITIEETSTGNIVNLAGLSQIDSIGGYLTIEDNDALPNLNELKNLKYLGRGLVIIDNDSLTSLAGLENLDSVGCLRIQNNHALKSLVGLDHISAIGGCYVNGGDFGYNGGGLIINGNNALTSMTGLNNLVSIAGCFKIENNPALTSMTGLEKLVFIGGECGWQAGSQGSYIINNPTLSTLKGLNNLTSISRIRISNNSALTSINDLSNLSSVEYTLNISNNAALSSFSALKSLDRVRGIFDVRGNASLTSFAGLERLRIGHNLNLKGKLNITGNPQLESLKGLDSLDFTVIADIDILNNSKLYICHAPPICAYLQNGGPATISNNAPGCNNIPEVKTACLVPTGETGPTGPPLHIFPNPAGDFLQIELPKSAGFSAEVQVFDTPGRLLLYDRLAIEQPFDVRRLPPGTYILKVFADGRAYAGRFVKL